MAHGQPDFGLYASKKTVYGLADLGELAARLGSFVTYDRRGDIVFADDFSHGLAPYELDVHGAGSSIAPSALRTKSGGFSCKMNMATYNVLGVSLKKLLPYPIISNLGIETSFTVTANLDMIIVNFYLYSGSAVKLGAIKYDHQAQTLSYYNSTGGYTQLESSFQLYASDYMFHTIKFVVDYETNYYCRLLLDQGSWDLSDAAIYNVASAELARTLILIFMVSNSGTAAAIFLDDFIVTQNEPAGGT